MNFQPNTTIYLCETDLILGSGHQIMFANATEQHAYFQSKVKQTFSEQTYQRYGIGSVRLDINVEQVISTVNYLMFQNLNYSTKWYYANILRVNYINENMTIIDYSIDSFQTFMFDMKLDYKSYIDRRSYSFVNDGFDKISQLPFEDLDVGDVYVPLDTIEKNLINPNGFGTEVSNWDETNKNTYIMVVSTERLVRASTVGHVISNSDVYYINNEAGGLSKPVYCQGTTGSMVFFTMFNFNALSYALEHDVFTSTELNGKIIGMFTLPYGETLLKLRPDYTTSLNQCDSLKVSPITDKTKNFVNDWGYNNFSNILEILHTHDWLDKYLSAVMDNVDISTKTGSFTDLINTALKSYLYRYPYSLFEVSDNGSNIVTYKPQNFLNGRVSQFLSKDKKSLTFDFQALFAPIGVFKWEISGYKNVPDNPFDLKNYDSILRPYNISQFTNRNTISPAYSTPIVNDYSSAFLQANFNQLNAQRTNASLSLDTAINNANASRNAQANANYLGYLNSGIKADTMIANSNINATMGLANAGLSYDNAHISATGSLINSGINAAGNILSLDFGGALSTGAKGSVNYGTAGMIAGNNLQMAQNSVGAMQATNLNSANAMMLQASNSLQASNGIMNANYANTLRNASLMYNTTINSLNARLQDINNMPDSVQGTFGNDLAQLLTFKSSLFVKTKSLPKDVLNRLANYFLLYGFKSNSFETINEVLGKWTTGGYIKTVNAFVYGSIPQDNLQEIKQVFDSGVFIWKGASNYMKWDEVKKQ